MKLLNVSPGTVRWLVAGAVVAIAGIGALGIVRAAGPQKAPHACCHPAGAATEPQRTEARYEVPDVTLTRADGTRVDLRREIDDGRPVILNFIYTTCTTVCPVMSRTFAQIQRRLGAGGDQAHLISISIDPEQDTPSRLTAYARQLEAGPAWRFYTGTQEASVALQRAFDVYRGDKMNHVPATFLRAAPGAPWVRLEGFVTADEALDAFHRLADEGRAVQPASVVRP
jgi:protein SCO1/2